MRFDRALIALVPRTVPHCIDLGVLFFGRHLGVMLQMWLLVALPCCGLVVLASRLMPFGIPGCFLLVLLASGPYGVLLMCGAGPRAFGERLTVGRAVRRMWSEARGTTVTVTALRPVILLGLAVCLFPGLLLAVRLGFLSERSALARLHENRFDRHTGDLVSSEMPELMRRAIVIWLFCFGLWGILTLTVDIYSSILLGAPLVTGQLTERMAYGSFESYIEYAWWHDTRLHVVLVATALLVYPIGRLAWFLCYIDLRVRRDCWDVELQFQEEAARLGGAHGAD